MSGLFDGAHAFLNQPRDGRVTLVHREHFSGGLVPLFRRSLEQGTRPGFLAMNEALRQRVENL